MAKSLGKLQCEGDHQGITDAGLLALAVRLPLCLCTDGQCNGIASNRGSRRGIVGKIESGASYQVCVVFVCPQGHQRGA